MPKFPRRETDVLALADHMISGFKSNASVFPNCNVSLLEKLCDDYQTAKAEQNRALTKAQHATDAKYSRLDALVNAMKKELEEAKIDASADHAKMQLLGWGDKIPFLPSDPPGPPRSLDCTIQGPSALFMDWKAPGRGSGGVVRLYAIERRERQSDTAPFGPWAQIEATIDSEVMLTDQPRGFQLEYRILAANNGGHSAPSTPISVKL